MVGSAVATIVWSATARNIGSMIDGKDGEKQMPRRLRLFRFAGYGRRRVLGCARAGWANVGGLIDRLSR